MILCLLCVPVRPSVWALSLDVAESGTKPASHVTSPGCSCSRVRTPVLPGLPVLLSSPISGGRTPLTWGGPLSLPAPRAASSRATLASRGRPISKQTCHRASSSVLCRQMSGCVFPVLPQQGAARRRASSFVLCRQMSGRAGRVLRRTGTAMQRDRTETMTTVRRESSGSQATRPRLAPAMMSCSLALPRVLFHHSMTMT